SLHIDLHAADLVAAGATPGEAVRQARLAIGGPEQVKEECRDARGTRWVEDLAQDVRYGVRLLRQKPGFTAVALLTLALGSGATTVMFTVVNGVLLKPLPFADPGRLLAVNGRSSDWNVAAFGDQNLALPDLRDFQRDARSVEVAGWMFSGGSLTSPGDPEYVDLREITHDLFHVLGTPLARGRAFLPEEDSASGQPVLILGYSMWQRKFGGSDAAIGASATLDGKRYTIVGVAPREIWWNGEPDVYTPVGQNPAPFLRGRRGHPMGAIARLRPGVTPAQAQAELDRIGRNLAVQYPATNRGRTFFERPLQPRVGQARSTLWLLMGAVSLVLLIACANVASLLLARAVARGRELAMRAALGAGRGRLIRQCLTESAVLGLCGGTLGVALAAAGIRPFLYFWPGGLPREDQARLDWRVLLFALGVSLLCGLIFGLAPALRVPARHLEETLRAGARAVGGSAGRLHGGFVAAQIAIAVVLLVAAGMLGRAVLRASALDPGLDIHNVLVARFALSPNILSDP